MADKLLGVRGSKPVGKYWAERLVTHSDELKDGFQSSKGPPENAPGGSRDTWWVVQAGRGY
jgi:hypothetical protein